MGKTVADLLILSFLDEGRKVPITVGGPKRLAWVRRAGNFPDTIVRMVDSSNPYLARPERRGERGYLHREIIPVLRNLSHGVKLPDIRSAARREFNLHIDKYTDASIRHARRVALKAGILNRDGSRGINYVKHNDVVSTLFNSGDASLDTILAGHDAVEHGLTGALASVAGEHKVTALESLLNGLDRAVTRTHALSLFTIMSDNIDMVNRIKKFGDTHPDIHPSEHYNEYAKHIIKISRDIRQGNKSRPIPSVDIGLS